MPGFKQIAVIFVVALVAVVAKPYIPGLKNL
jgi:hypothetical protein